MINQVILLGQFPSSVHKYSENKDKSTKSKKFQQELKTHNNKYLFRSCTSDITSV